MDFKAILFALAGIVLGSIIMVKLGMATHNSPFTVATSTKDKVTASKMSSSVKPTTGYVI